MTTFPPLSFDSSGVVRVYGDGWYQERRWTDLTPFAQGYVEALFASLPVLCQTCEGNGEVVTDWETYLHLPKGAEADAGTATCAVCDGQGRATYAFSDLSREALALIRKDCASMEYIATGFGMKKVGAKEGRNFWNGRQAGGYRLSSVVSVAFPPVAITLNDDGKVYLTPKDK